MFDLRDLFQWERFITPSIIKVFYWLAVIITVVSGLSGILSGLAELVSRRDPDSDPLRVRADHVSHQRAPRRDPQPRADLRK
jgi:hypothetical protein